MKKIAERPETPKLHFCDTHGAYEERYIEWFGGGYMVSEQCPDCAAAEKRKQEEKEDQERKSRAASIILSKKLSAGVSRRNADIKFKNFICENEQMEAAKKKVYDFAKAIFDGEDTPSLILTGGVGTGKTMLACATINAIVDKRRCKMVKMIDMFRSLKETWRKDSEYTETQLISKYSQLDLLIIDEVGVNFDSDTEKMFIFDIIDGRYQNMRPTMLISNLSIGVIKDIIGERSFDRLKDGGGESVAFDWESKRK